METTDGPLDPRHPLAQRIGATEGSGAYPGGEQLGTIFTLEIARESLQGEEISFNESDIREYLQEMINLNRLPMSLEVSVDGDLVGKGTGRGYSVRGKADKKFITRKAKGATLDVYVSEKTERTGFARFTVLNYGMPQYKDSVYLGDEYELPQSIVVDVKSDGSPDSANYPFTTNRESLRGLALAMLNKIIKKDLASAVIEAEHAIYIERINDAALLPHRTASRRAYRHLLIDTSLTTPKEFRQELAEHPYMYGLSRAM